MIRIWDLETGELLRSLPDPDSVVWVTFTPDGRRLLFGGLSWAVRLCDSSSGEPLRPLEGHRDRVTCVKFSPDGGRDCVVQLRRDGSALAIATGSGLNSSSSVRSMTSFSSTAR